MCAVSSVSPHCTCVTNTNSPLNSNTMTRGTHSPPHHPSQKSATLTASAHSIATPASQYPRKPLAPSLRHLYNLAFQPSKKPNATLMHADTSITHQIQTIASEHLRTASYLLLGLNILHKYKTRMLDIATQRFRRMDAVQMAREDHESTVATIATLRSNEQLNMHLEEMCGGVMDASMILMQRAIPAMIEYRIMHNDADEALNTDTQLRCFQQFIEQEIADWQDCETPLGAMPSSASFFGMSPSQHLESPENARRMSLPAIVDLPPIDFQELDFGVGEGIGTGGLIQKRASDAWGEAMDLDFGDVAQEMLHETPGRPVVQKKRKRAVIVDDMTVIDNRTFASWLANARSIKRRRASVNEEGTVVAEKNVVLSSFPAQHELGVFFAEVLGMKNVRAESGTDATRHAAEDDFAAPPPPALGDDLSPLPAQDLAPYFDAPLPSVPESPRPGALPHDTSTADDDTERLRIRNEILTLAQEQHEFSFPMALSLDSKLDASRAFYQLLVLKTEDRIQVTQRKAFGEILVKRCD